MAPSFLTHYAGHSPARPFDARRSMQIDAIIVQLEVHPRPGWLRRTLLRWHKRRLERIAGVMPIGPRGPKQPRRGAR